MPDGNLSRPPLTVLQRLQSHLLGSNRVAPQFVRYVIVGLGAMAVDAGTFAMFRVLGGLGLVESNLAGRIVGALVAFVGHRHVTFRRDHGERASATLEILRYFALLALSMTLSSTLLWLVAGYLFDTEPGIIETAVKLVLEGGILSFNYILQRLWVFRAHGLTRTFQSR